LKAVLPKVVKALAVPVVSVIAAGIPPVDISPAMNADGELFMLDPAPRYLKAGTVTAGTAVPAVIAEEFMLTEVAAAAELVVPI
jgi:hypothetical protein